MNSLGKNEVIGCLEYWLEQAKLDAVNYIALAAVQGRDQCAYDYAGAFGCERAAQDALHTLGQELEAIQNARKIGPRIYSKHAACVEYPLSGIAPLNWDFLIWLIDCEITRRRLGAPPPLRVAFSKREQLVDPIKQEFFEHVIKPLVPMVGGIIDDDALGGRHKQIYVTHDLVVAARAGELMPKLRAAPKARELVASVLHGISPVTITLREAAYVPTRNSNIEAWLRFGRELEQAGEKVIFVRDTAKTMLPLDHMATFPSAAYDVNIRLALYDAAKVNLFVSNGPGGLAFFSDRPYLYFVNNRPGADDYDMNDPDWWFNANGIAVGEQWPWAMTSQRLIWATDDYENIVSAWQNLCALGR